MPIPAPSVRPVTRAIAVVAATCVAAVAVGHPDDPKVRDKMPRYEGAGWVEASDAEGPQFDALGATLRGWITLPEFSTNPASGNDCWGWTSPAGREYALMGLNNGTAFVEVTNPSNPVIRDIVPGNSSLWRDVKTYQHYAYVVTEATGGDVQVIDMSQLDATGQVALVNTFAGSGTSSTHNVAIDEVSGFLYRSGGSGQGIRIHDLSDPVNPVQVATWSTKYVHDLQVVTMEEGPFAGRQLAFLCSGFNGGFLDTGLTILDVSDKSNLVVLDEFLYPFSAYSHQAWLNEDRTRLYLNDELDEGDFGIGSTIHVFDVSNPADIGYEGAFTNDNPAIGHNLYIRGDRLYGAHYRSGLRVFDLSTDPLAPAEIAYFDTFPSDDSPNFNGAWSVYPYFESGTVIISDIERGLFVIDLQEPRVAVSYPDGRPELVDPAGQTIRAAIEELQEDVLVGATVRLVAESDADGGQVTAPMVPLGKGQWEGELPPAACGATVAWWIEVVFGDEEVATSPPGAPGATWTALAATGRTTIVADDGETPGGWSVVNQDVAGGAWERGIPSGDGDRGDPLVDFDGSGRAWLTENAAGNTDVDGGPTILESQVYDVPTDQPLVLRYATWFTNDDGDDEFRTEASVDGGDTWFPVQTTGSLTGWQERAVRLDDLATPTGSLRVRFLATDNPNNSVTEAGIDAVRIEVLECGAPTLPEDVDGDGTVGFTDVLAVLAQFGPCDGSPCPADVDGSGVVTFQDLLAVLAAWS